jgi:hypothetical protein
MLKFGVRCLTFLGSLLFASLPAYATSGWTGYASVAELTPTMHQRYLVKLTKSENPSGCRNKEMFYQDYDTPGSKLMFRTLLEAVVSGNKVRVYVTGKCALDGYSEITSVGIVPQ